MVEQPQRWFHKETINDGRIMSTRKIGERLWKKRRLTNVWCILASSYWLSVVFGLHMVLGGRASNNTILCTLFYDVFF